MRQADGQLLGQKLRGAEEGSCGDDVSSAQGSSGATTQSGQWIEYREAGKGQRTCGRLIAKLHHLAQTHAGCWEPRIVADGVHQRLGRPP